MILTSILKHKDILEYLLLNCEIETLESLVMCNIQLNSFLNNKHIINILLKKHGIIKEINSFKEYSKEYYHRFQRSKFGRIDNYYHLLWAVIDNDNNTINNIINDIKLKTEIYNIYIDLYNIIFEAGKRDNKLVHSKFRNWTYADSIYLAGMAHSGNYNEELLDRERWTIWNTNVIGEYDWDDDTIFKAEYWLDIIGDDLLSIIIFEAARGNNQFIITELTKIMYDNYKPLYQRAIILGYTAGNNVELLVKELEYPTLESIQWREYKLPLIENELRSFGLDDSFCELPFPKCEIDELISCALYYNSNDVLNYLIRDYKPHSDYLGTLLLNCRPKYIKSLSSIEIYKWINAYSDGNMCHELIECVKNIAMMRRDSLLINELKININS